MIEFAKPRIFDRAKFALLCANSDFHAQTYDFVRKLAFYHLFFSFFRFVDGFDKVFEFFRAAAVNTDIPTTIIGYSSTFRHVFQEKTMRYLILLSNKHNPNFDNNSAVKIS